MDQRRRRKNGPRLSSLVVSITITVSALFDANANEPVGFRFDAHGMQSMTFGGTELLNDSRPRLMFATWATGEAVHIPTKPGPETIYDEQARRLEQTWNFGRLVTVYRPENDKLGLSLTFTNTTDRPLRDLDLSAMKLAFPETPYGPGWHQSLHCSSVGIDDAAAVIAKFGSGTLVAVAESFEPELRLQIYSNYDKEHRIYSLRCNTVTHSARDFVHVDQPEIGPGKSVHFDISLRFGRVSVGFDELAGDVFAKYAERFPPVLKWDDRRPIAMLMLASADEQHHSQTNPRGWLNNPKIDVVTPAGREAFKTTVLAWADRAAARCRSMAAQGVIAWDIEGEEFPRLVYVGDPRMLPELAPEMDAIADAFFKKFTDAGLKTGVCIRPSRLYRPDVPNPNPPWKHGHMVFDPVAELADKIAYAKRRWGCALFYIDTNVTSAYTGDKDKNGAEKIDSWTMRADSMRRLAVLHPDVLIIPEFQYTGYYSHVSGYKELRRGQAATPTRVLTAYPEAFSVINVSDGKMKERRADLLAAVKRGDILLYRGWSKSPEEEMVRFLYQEAGKTGRNRRNK